MAESTATLVYHIENLTPKSITSGEGLVPDINDLLLTIRVQAQGKYRDVSRAKDNILPVRHTAGYLRDYGEHLDAVVIFTVVPDRTDPTHFYIEKGVEIAVDLMKQYAPEVKATKKGHIDSEYPPLDDYHIMQMLGLLPKK